MHILILNFNSLQSVFIQRGLRYENIGADVCQPENLSQIWYGQYDAIVIPVQSWHPTSYASLLKIRSDLGTIPTLLTSRTLPPEKIKNEIKNDENTLFIGSHLPFQALCDALKELIYRKYTSAITDDNKIKVGDLTLDLRSRFVERQQQNIYLRNREFSLLTCFMQNANKVLTRTFLLETVWDRNTSILSNTVDVHVSRLRKKIDGEFHEKKILTIPCIGYKLIT